MTQGFNSDGSDVEWDISIREEFGSRGLEARHGGDRELDTGMAMENLVQHTFHIYDGLVGGVGVAEDIGQQEREPDGSHEPDAMDHDDPAPEVNVAPSNLDDIPAVPQEDGLMDDDLPAMETAAPSQHELLADSALTPLFPGSGLTQLGGTLLMLNCLRTHGASNQLVNEVFAILSKSMLPKVNSLPTSEYQASKVLKRLGLAYNTIHCCPGPKTCVLFRGEDYKDLESCPVCGANRYRLVGKTKVPLRVLRHFPLIPRLQRNFSTPVQASYMTWHARHRSDDDVMRGAVDGYQWRYVDWKWQEEFAFEHRNLRLGLATDGVNPFSIKRSTWSTWPVLILNYNLPPWMTTKKHFIMLALIIPGKKSVTGDNFDVYLQPLLEELKILWHQGVPTDDASMYQGSRRFNLKAMLLWSIHDFPAYGVVAGCVTKGYRGCPVCGEHTISRRSRALRKNVYDDQYRRFLPHDHPWRRARPEFGGRAESRDPPPKMCPHDIIRYGRLREDWLSVGSGPASSDPARAFGVKRVSALFDLPYWKVTSILEPLNSCFNIILCTQY